MFLNAAGISKRHLLGEQSVQALKAIDLTVQKGSFVCISGASGSGKSTLLHILGLLEPPDTGSLILDNISVPLHNKRHCDRLRAQKIGFIFQQFHLLEQLTVLENILIALKIAKIPSPLSKAQKALNDVGLKDKYNRFPRQLSGGEQQRVAIARAIAKSPPLLLADEPTANLDSQNSHQLIELLQDLHQKEALTVVCVSHDPLLIESAQREIILKDGCILADNTQ